MRDAFFIRNQEYPSQFTPHREMLLGAEGLKWSDSDVPLAERGIQVMWLNHFVRSIMEPMRKAFYTFDRANWAIDQMERHSFYPVTVEDPILQKHPAEPILVDPGELTTRQLVEHYVAPLTLSSRAPLYALVPPEARGVPSMFVSHAWSDPICQGRSYNYLPGNGTLDTLDDLRVESAYVWIDFACYNPTYL
jgi:hypothetical protein